MLMTTLSLVVTPAHSTVSPSSCVVAVRVRVDITVGEVERRVVVPLTTVDVSVRSAGS